jgi:hypothetical protein
MLSFTIRRLAGNFLQELNSFSPASSPATVGPGIVGGDDAGIGVIVAPPGSGLDKPPPARARRSCRGVGVGVGAADGDGDGDAGDGDAVFVGGVGVGPAPETIAAPAIDDEKGARNRSANVSDAARLTAR